MQNSNLKFHDVSNFPIVRLVKKEYPEGYICDWIEDMEILCASKERFVIIFEGNRNEGHEDRKQRSLWFKKNMDRLVVNCAAMIYIEPDEAGREAQLSRLEKLNKAVAVNMVLAGSDEEAAVLGHELIKKAG